VRLPTAIVEPLIALSVAYVAVENILVGTGGSHRPAIVFLFGLIHGLGFADALGEAGVILCAARRSSTKPTQRTKTSLEPNRSCVTFTEVERDPPIA